MNETPFGPRARDAKSAVDLLALEAAEGRSPQFSQIDVVIAGIMIRAMRGERVVRLAKTDRGDAVSIVGVPDALKASLPEVFQLEAQQARGAWFIPEAVPIKARSLLFAALFRETPRYAHTLAADEKGKFALGGNPDAMVVWSVLEGFADVLLAPIFLRVEESGLLPREEFNVRWAEVERGLVELGLTLVEELRPFSWGGGWARFSADEQLASKARLLNAMATQVSADVVHRYRATVTQKLVAQYYAKAKKGRAKRRQVISKEYARTLAGFFAGDWLSFVRYLGEEPHDEERVVTALPEPKVIVSGKSKAADVAARKGVPVEEVERILGAFWSDSSANSPVLDRVSVFADYWRHLDAIHARQVPGMPPLWGLVEDGGWATLEPQPHTPYQGALYRRLLPADLVARVDRLWGSTVLVKWPDRVVSEPFPHSAMAETFGPALKFWHGCALTAWFVCEGPMSRTDIPGLADYYRRELVALEDMHCPVHPQLFEELKSVRLGPEEPIYSRSSNIDVGYGISIGVQTSSGLRRHGFELLRDVINRHRQWWAAHYLDAYLRARWETELKSTARQFHLMSEEKGKPPTLKQFAKHAVEPAQHWFGGDVGLLYASLGQKLVGEGVRRSLRMPNDRVAFAGAVFAGLGGIPFERQIAVADREEGQRVADEQDRHHKLRRLAAESLTYVQLVEALDRAPTLKEFGSKFEWPSKVLAEDPDAAWGRFAQIIEGLLARATTR
jgi:hypothetical protein